MRADLNGRCIYMRQVFSSPRDDWVQAGGAALPLAGQKVAVQESRGILHRIGQSA